MASVLIIPGKVVKSFDLLKGNQELEVYTATTLDLKLTNDSMWNESAI